MAVLVDAIGNTPSWKPVWLPAVQPIGDSANNAAHLGHTPQQRRHAAESTFPLPALQEKSEATVYGANGRLAIPASERVGRQVNLYI